MKSFSTYKGIVASARGSVLAIGNFDGVHKGHQALIATAREIARRENKPLGVMTFEPHPVSVFRPETAPFRLTLEPMKARRLEISGIDLLFSLNFDRELFMLNATDFIQRVLVEGLGVSHIVVGADFTFGHGRTGDVHTLKNDGRFGVTVFAQQTAADGTVYSSTIIRNYLREGDLAAANALLGWEWEMEGEVIHGNKRGRELGYPTANVDLGAHVRPRFGIYAVQVAIDTADWLPAVANIGIRPMFEAPMPLAEAFIFDFDSDIYGSILRIRPIKHLRDEAKFDSLDALVVQMKKDCEKAKEALSRPCEGRGPGL